MERVIRIKECMECPYYYSLPRNGIGSQCKAKRYKDIPKENYDVEDNTITIPDWCPLEEIKEVNATTCKHRNDSS